MTLEKQKKRIRLSVFNTTEQISKEHMEHLFDRSIEQTGQEIPRQEDMDWDFPLQPLQWKHIEGRLQRQRKNEKSLLITVIFPIS